MKKETKQVLISLGVMLAALLCLEAAFRTSGLRDELDMEDLFTSRLHHLKDLDAAPDVVAIGNSRVRHGIDPDVIGEVVARRTKHQPVVFNLGMGGGIAQPQLAWSLRLLDNPRPPRVVVLLVSPTDFHVYEKPELAHKVRTRLWRVRDIPSVIRAGAPAEDVLTIAVSSALTTMSHRARILDVLLAHEQPGPAMGPDVAGFLPIPPVAPEVQRAHAVSRAEGYREELVGDDVSLSEFKIGCLDEAVRRLTRAGVEVVIVNSPASTPIQRLADVEGSLVPEYLRLVEAIADKHGVLFLDHLAPPVITDPDFADGDHLDRNGARRYSAFLTAQAILPAGWKTEPGAGIPFARPTEPSQGCEVLFDFEDVITEGWTTRGAAFDRLVASGAGPGQSPVSGFKGSGMLSSWHPTSGDAARGKAISPPFEISRPSIRLLLGGGSKNVLVQLVVAGKVVFSASGKDREKLQPVVWNVSGYIGRQATIVVRDESAGGWGHISVDQIELCN